MIFIATRVTSMSPKTLVSNWARICCSVVSSKHPAGRILAATLQPQAQAYPAHSQHYCKPAANFELGNTLEWTRLTTSIRPNFFSASSKALSIDD
jgi:hypothetical protein